VKVKIAASLALILLTVVVGACGYRIVRLKDIGDVKDEFPEDITSGLKFPYTGTWVSNLEELPGYLLLRVFDGKTFYFEFSDTRYRRPGTGPFPMTNSHRPVQRYNLTLKADNEFYSNFLAGGTKFDETSVAEVAISDIAESHIRNEGKPDFDEVAKDAVIDENTIQVFYILGVTLTSFAHRSYNERGIGAEVTAAVSVGGQTKGSAERTTLSYVIYVTPIELTPRFIADNKINIAKVRAAMKVAIKPTISALFAKEVAPFLVSRMSENETYPMLFHKVETDPNYPYTVVRAKAVKAIIDGLPARAVDVVLQMSYDEKTEYTEINAILASGYSYDFSIGNYIDKLSDNEVIKLMESVSWDSVTDLSHIVNKKR
jgi:hypothetical protein